MFLIDPVSLSYGNNATKVMLHSKEALSSKKLIEIKGFQNSTPSIVNQPRFVIIGFSNTYTLGYFFVNVFFKIESHPWAVHKDIDHLKRMEK